jgi:hypothetical protein
VRPSAIIFLDSRHSRWIARLCTSWRNQCEWISTWRSFVCSFNASSTSLRVFLARWTRVARVLVDTRNGLKASRLWATRPSGCWSPLERAPRGEKLPKDCLTASVLPKPKQQLCIQSGTRAYYLNYLQEVGEAGKRSAGNRIGYQVIDRQVEDRQTRPMSAGTQADRAAS